MKTSYPNIYIDEAGNTGSDINNSEQKFFILASVCFSDEELTKIKNDINYQKELHFIDMKKSIDGRDAIKRVLSHPLLDKDHLTYQFVDKQFCIYAQITDMLIEPVFLYKFKANLYLDKANILMANCLFTFAEDYKNKELLNSFKRSFASMFRNQTQDSIDSFYECVSLMQKDAIPQFNEILLIIEESKNILKYCLVEDKTYCLDTTVSSLIVLVDHWHKIFKKKIVVTTDHSKQISAKRDLIKKLCEIKGQNRVGYDTRTSPLPLPINNLEMVASQDSFGVQLADMVASAVAFRYNDASKKFHKFQNEIKTLPFFQLPCYPIAPSPIEDLLIKEDCSNNIDAIDYL